MAEKISKRNKLLELLKVETLTTKEIVEKLKIPIEHIWTYLSQFMKEGKVLKVGKQGKYNLYKAVEDNPIKLLRQLYNFMSDKNKCEIKDFQDNDLELVQTIKELIK